MIIDVKQVKNNFKIEFQIYENESLVSMGKCSRISSMLSNYLLDLEGNLIYETKFDPIKEVTNSIPFKWLWSKKKSDVNYIIDSSNKKIGRIERVTEGFLKCYYNVYYFDNIFKIYTVSLGPSKYLMIFLDNIQIGMIVKNLSIKNNLDQYRLYLLDSYRQFSLILSLYMLYYDNFHFGNRDEIVVYKEEKSWEWSFSRTDRYFNPHWLNENFGLPVIDFEKIRKQGTVFAYVFGACFLVLAAIAIYFKFFHN